MHLLRIGGWLAGWPRIPPHESAFIAFMPPVAKGRRIREQN